MGDFLAQDLGSVVKAADKNGSEHRVRLTVCDHNICLTVSTGVCQIGRVVEP